ncbi:MAG TPA: hypothetical protein VI704_02090, partial [Bacteroidota bacterium]|nr:hypothetical protein [Bacteroidota bacterium]
MSSGQGRQGPAPFHIRLSVAAAAVMAFFGLAWVLYQRATFLHGDQTEDAVTLQHQVVFQDEDTLRHNGYTIVRTEVGVEISKNGKTIYHSPGALDRKEFNETGLASLLGNNTKQLVIQRFSGGSECCWSSWVLELADSLRFLYRSEDYPELGYELGFADYDKDGTIELTQTNMSFDRFDRLTHAASPFSTAFFKYSTREKRYMLANRSFVKLFLEEASWMLATFIRPMRRLNSLLWSAGMVRRQSGSSSVLAFQARR